MSDASAASFLARVVRSVDWDRGFCAGQFGDVVLSGDRCVNSISEYYRGYSAGLLVVPPVDVPAVRSVHAGEARVVLRLCRAEPWGANAVLSADGQYVLNLQMLYFLRPELSVFTLNDCGPAVIRLVALPARLHEIVQLIGVPVVAE